MGHSSFLFSTGAWDQVLVKYWTWPCRGRFLVLAIGEESSLGPFLVLVIGEESSLGPFLVLVIGEESSLGASRFWPFKKTQVLVLDWKMEYQVLAMYGLHCWHKSQHLNFSAFQNRLHTSCLDNKYLKSNWWMLQLTCWTLSPVTR